MHPKDREEDIDTRYDRRAIPCEKNGSRVVHARESKDQMWARVLEDLDGSPVWGSASKDILASIFQAGEGFQFARSHSD